MNKTRVKTLLVVILLILTGCNNSNEIEMNELEMEIFKNIRDAEFGARSPKLLYGTEKYALILDVEGLIIYDISRGKVN